MNKVLTLEMLIIGLMFLLLPIDMLNGLLLHNNINLPLSISQAFKLLIILLLFINISTNINKIKLSLFFISILLLPTFYQCFKKMEVSFLFQDIIKISKYLLPFFSFLFFAKLFKSGDPFYVKFISRLVKISYLIFVLNILLKYLGLGYAMYPNSGIGSKGFFFAGNETSVLLVILSSILAYRIWNKGEKAEYILFFLFNLFVGLTISSKTGTLGILLVFLLIPLKSLGLKVSVQYFKRFLLISCVLIPVLISVMWKVIKISPVFVRLKYFWERLDFWTFVFSNRNKFFERAWNNYWGKYDFVEKIIGVGQSQYEAVNGNSIVEIDFADIFFAYGIIGSTLFFILMGLIWRQTSCFKRYKGYPYAGLVLLMIAVLFGISTIAGHVYSSGMAAVYIGLLYALMYYRSYENKRFI